MRALMGIPLTIACLAAGSPLQAMPLDANLAASSASVTLVRDGCGPFGHRSHYGYCKENGDGGYPYEAGGFRRPGYGPGRYNDDGYGYGGPRCYIQDSWNGPVRVCR